MKNLIIVLLTGLVLLSFGTASFLIARWNWHVELAFQAQSRAEKEAAEWKKEYDKALDSLIDAQREVERSRAEQQKIKLACENQVNELLGREQALQVQVSTLQRKVEQLTVSNEALQSQSKAIEQRAKVAEAAARGQQTREKSVNAPVAVMRDGPAPKRLGDF